MNIGKKIATVTAAAAFVALSAGSALAVSAHASGSVNVRTGPGTSYSKVDSLHAGESVEVRQCQDGWCYIEHSGADGWVSANYLSQNGYSSPNQPSKKPSVQFQFGFGNNGSGFGFSFGTPPGKWPNNPPGNWPAPPMPQVSQACFYSGSNYSGNQYCLNAGTDVSFVGPQWNDRISSVRIIGNASVTMCQHTNYGGYCRTTGNDEPALGPWLNDEVSSLSVQ